MDDRIKSQRAREAQEELSGLRALQGHKGFQELLKIAQIQVDNRTQQIFLNPLKSLDAALEQEYSKGEVAGIKLFMEMTKIRIQDLEDEIKGLLNEEDGSNNLDEVSGHDDYLDDE